MHHKSAILKVIIITRQEERMRKADQDCKKINRYRCMVNSESRKKKKRYTSVGENLWRQVMK